MSTINKNPPNVQTVDYSRHATLKVKPNPGFAHAKDRNLVAVNVAEVGICSSNFPLAFIQNPADKQYSLMALLGLKRGENIFYGEEFWSSTYVPLAIQRHPFVIGYDERLQAPEQLATCLEMDSAYVSEKDGQALFDADGNETEFLRNVHQGLNTMFEASKFTRQFIQKLVELDLVVPLALSLQTQKGEGHKVAGLFTVDEKKLKNLSAERLKDLQTRDFLAPCFLILVSLYQLNQLIRRRNLSGGDQIVNFRIELNGQEQAAQ